MLRLSRVRSARIGGWSPPVRMVANFSGITGNQVPTGVLRYDTSMNHKSYTIDRKIGTSLTRSIMQHGNGG